MHFCTPPAPGTMISMVAMVVPGRSFYHTQAYAHEHREQRTAGTKLFGTNFVLLLFYHRIRTESVYRIPSSALVRSPSFCRDPASALPLSDQTSFLLTCPGPANCARFPAFDRHNRVKRKKQQNGAHKTSNFVLRLTHRAPFFKT